MNLSKNKTGFIIKADDNCTVKEVIHDEILSLESSASLLEHVERSSITKLLSFFKCLKDEKSAIGWEINMKVADGFRAYHFGGFKDEEHFCVIGTDDVQETRKYFNELTAIANKQQNILRDSLKKDAQKSLEVKVTEQSFNELTKINNEMANLQRQLAKKNIELKKLNTSLEEKNKELDQFTYIVSHDLKAPLRGINSLIEIIDEDYNADFPDEVSDLFDKIKTRSTRMNDLITAILNYSRAGKTDTKIVTFNVSDLFTEIVDSLEIPSGFKIQVPPSELIFECSYVQLSQILTNIIGNAIKYHDNKSEGKVKIEMIPEGELIKFRISDNGPGIPEKYHSKIFEPFETANETSRTDSTGIGLAIVKKLVERYGGQMGLESELGKGSKFWFTFPQKTHVGDA